MENLHVCGLYYFMRSFTVFAKFMLYYVLETWRFHSKKNMLCYCKLSYIECNPHIFLDPCCVR